MTKTNCIDNCVSAIVELERAQRILSLLFEENDEAISAAESEEVWRMVWYCRRAETWEALIATILRSVSESKTLIDEILDGGIQ